MLPYPEIDPVAVAIGPLKIHWYGLAYLAGIAAGWWLALRRCDNPWSPVRREHVDDLVFYVALGVVLGGRVGYTLFYGGERLTQDPSWALRLWEGGMSFHGGFLGVLLAMYLFGRKHQIPFWRLMDFIAPFVPIGLGLGRLGNFIGQELWGRPTDLPWGMVFPFVDAQPRHPSMLYEALLEGLVLFVVLWLYSSKPRPTRAVSGMFLLCYGVFRFGVEFVREPDAHIGYLAMQWLTMGHLLSAPMIVFGVLLLALAYRKRGEE